MTTNANYYNNPPLKLKARKTKGPHRLLKGWRWLANGEWVKLGDVVCDPRGMPVKVVVATGKKGAWQMGKDCHPVRRKCGGQISHMD